jgi:hypothetical protein
MRRAPLMTATAETGRQRRATHLRARYARLAWRARIGAPSRKRSMSSASSAADW